MCSNVNPQESTDFPTFLSSCENLLEEVYKRQRIFYNLDDLEKVE